MNKLLPASLLLLLLSGCASYSTGFRHIESLLEQQKPDSALLALESISVPSRDRLLYVLNRAMLQRMNGLYAESNVSFEEAKKLIDKLQATSITEQVSALAVNDSVRSYEGEPFEQVAIHVYEALNYIALDQLDDARVEALQADVRLHQQTTDEDSHQGASFLRYLTGLIYEAEGEFDNALISYRKAYVVYEDYKGVSVPSYLKQDLLRLTKRLGLKDEYKMYKEKFSLESVRFGDDKKEGEVIFILNHGLAPIKRSHDVFVNSNDGVPLRISLPQYETRASHISGGQLHIGNQTTDLVIANDFDALAKQSLERSKAATIARLVARAVVKHALSEAAERRSGDVAGFLVDIAMLATETSDTRSWLTLPKNIYMSRLWLESGEYPAKLTLFGSHGGVVAEIDLGKVDVLQGKKLFIERTYINIPTPITTDPEKVSSHEEEGSEENHDEHDESDEKKDDTESDDDERDEE